MVTTALAAKRTDSKFVISIFSQVVAIMIAAAATNAIAAKFDAKKLAPLLSLELMFFGFISSKYVS